MTFIDAVMKKRNLKADSSSDEAVRRTIQEQAAQQPNKSPLARALLNLLSGGEAMARLRTLPSILLLLSPGLAVYCAGESLRPVPAECTDPISPGQSGSLPAAEAVLLWLKPGRYQHLSWRMKTWDMVSGRLDQILQPETERRNLPYQPGKEGWYTLSCEDRPRFLFQMLPQLMSVWWRGPDGLYTPFAELLLPLKRGATWTSHRMKGRSYILQNASCTSDDIETGDGRVEALRVVFTEHGELRHTMWFTRKAGLVRWDGVEIAPIYRFPGGGPDQQLLAAAMAYAGYGRVDNLTRFALVDCKVPPPVPARLSESHDESTHGRKLYYVFAKDLTGYCAAKTRDQRDGQIVVKESWIPGNPRKKGPLFLMLKSEGEWVYATATPDGMTLTSSGRLASCTRCHESEKTSDRLFGVKSDVSNNFLEVRYCDSKPEDMLLFERRPPVRDEEK